ncbi:MAG: PaaI family thioesterase [Candidatus Dadabacteria bacterium]|nr:MAG: PaaI family thioesterase [Candidatus Dadabacteria bacterium]
MTRQRRCATLGLTPGQVQVAAANRWPLRLDPRIAPNQIINQHVDIPVPICSNERTLQVTAPWLQALHQHPYHNSCGVRVVRTKDGESHVRFDLNAYTLNGAGFLHGGVLYGLMDVACFAAAVPLLSPDQQIVTHDIHCSILAPVTAAAETVDIYAHVIRRGRSLIFLRAEACVAGDDESPRTIALCTLTKSIVSGRIAR